MNPTSSDAVSAHGQAQRCGVLLANLGTPDAPTSLAIRRYLAEFLNDRRVVEIPRAIWWPILYGFILPFRPRRLAHARSEEHTSELQSLMRTSYAVFSLKKKKHISR